MTVPIEKTLAFKYPLISEEWHPIKNNGLTPYDVYSKANKKVWWKCSKGHEWDSVIGNRTNGKQNCPYCSGKRVSSDNCLANHNQLLVSEWHPRKNGDTTPYNVTLYSHKKVWWKCAKGHEWESTVAHRSNGRGCPFCCVGPREVDFSNCLAFDKPVLAQEWNFDKNKRLTPLDVTSGSGKKVWWSCNKCGNGWRAAIFSRSSGRGVP